MKKIVIVGLVGFSVLSGAVCGKQYAERDIQKRLDAEYEKAQTELVYEYITVKSVSSDVINTDETAHNDLKAIAQEKGLKQFKKATATFSNGSTLVAYPQLERYYFTPYEMGDWDYELKNEAEAKKMIMTYLSMKATGTF